MSLSETEVSIQLEPLRRGEAPVVRGNALATLLLNDIGIKVFGFNFTAGAMRIVRSGLRRGIERGGFQGEYLAWTKRELHIVLHVFNKLKDYPGEVIYVGATGCADTDPEAILRHEKAHSAQRKLGSNGDDIGHAGDPVAFLEHPLARKAADALVNDLGYDDEPHTLMSEIGAHLAEGLAGTTRMRLTEAEGEDLFELYWNAVLERNGNRVYHEPALLSLLEQWSLTNEPHLGTDGEAQPREGRGFAQRKGTAGQFAAPGERSHPAQRYCLKADERQGTGSCADAHADARGGRAGSRKGGMAQHRQREQGPAAGVTAAELEIAR